MTLDTLKKCELIDEKGRIHDWSKHGLKLLVSTRKRMRRYRERLRNRNVTVTPTVPNLTVPNLTNNNIPQEIYDYYSKTIKSGGKEDAIRSITKLLKTRLTKDDLIARIDAYKAQLQKERKEDRAYYIQANNFFGRQARYKDFEPVKQKYKAADPNCKVCKDHPGIKYIENTNQTARCDCTLIK